MWRKGRTCEKTVKGKGENGNDSSNWCYLNVEKMMMTSGSIERIAERFPTWYMFVVV